MRHVRVQLGHRIAARKRDVLLKDDVAGVELLAGVMNRGAGHGIVGVVGPEQRQRAPMARQQRGVQVDGTHSRQTGQFRRQQLRKNRNANEIGPHVAQSLGGVRNAVRIQGQDRNPQIARGPLDR